MENIDEKFGVGRAIKAMGLVFGDIGTSPIYTFTVIFLTTQITMKNVMGVLSLIIWTLILLVSIQYAWLAMSLSKRGEGGAIVLNQILKRFLKSSRSIAFFSLLTFVGVSLLIGDSVITPAISLLSAVEGLHFIPNLGEINQTVVLAITIIITVLLFYVQKNGTEKISRVFGPVMLVWFLTLGISGIAAIYKLPVILNAINPAWGLKFLLSNGLAGFFVLSEVILCATGAEALYADMGHLGRQPIIHAWFFVFFMLIFNYLGQGVFLILNPQAKNILFSMIATQSEILYIPFLLISILATIIASQAMISGLFSVVYQGINTHILPLFKINYTSEKLKAQIYISAVNWFLLIFVLIVILVFKQSDKLASAYGFAVAGTISITAIMISAIFFLKKKYFYFILAMILLVMDLSFFAATTIKIPTGAYWSILISIIPLSLIILYTKAHKKLYKSITPMHKHVFLEKFDMIYPHISKIKGSALFFIRNIEKLPPYVIQTMFTNNIIYTDNIFVTIHKTGDPHGLSYDFSDIAPGLRLFKITTGYMEVFNLEKIIRTCGIREKVIFYGIEDIETKNFFWHIFAIIKKLTPSFIHFYKLPTHKVHGVVTTIEMDKV